MATLYVTEFRSVLRDNGGLPVPVADTARMATQKVTYTTSAASAAFSGNTSVIRVLATSDAHLSFGSSPTAAATDMLIKANTAEYFGVRPGQKVAAYDGSS